MPSYLITGASRGLGLGFAAELLKNPDNVVVATARNTAASAGLQELKSHDTDDRLKLIDLDVSKLESVHEAAEKAALVLPNGLDNLISNAGISNDALKTWDQMELEDLTSELNFTVTAPFFLIREFLPLVRKSQQKKIYIVTSRLGSIQTAAFLPNLANAYSIARAALNMLARKWSPVLKDEGVTIGLINPGYISSTSIGDGISGWVEDHPGKLESITVEDSITGCLKVLDDLTLEDTGSFFNFDGAKLAF
ncbi:putative short-chain dehydrogenase [Xylariales sp. PMI_506]|nr:putative short-chain dehydrogenase [Xylariales sp. PMI_506]